MLALRDPDIAKVVEHSIRGLVKTMKKESPAVSISSPSLKWPKISRITTW